MEETVNIIPWPYGPHEGTLVPTEEEAGMAPELVQTLLKMGFEPHVVQYIV
jgi:hypothetical protein